MFTLSDPDPEDEQDLCPVIVSLAQRRHEWAIGFRIYEVCYSIEYKELLTRYLRLILMTLQHL